MEPLDITPTPTDDEVVAILAAHEALWPRPVVAGAGDGPREDLRWRFSGRWWSKPAALRRDRPGSGY
jgi:hypothetical protein